MAASSSKHRRVTSDARETRVLQLLSHIQIGTYLVTAPNSVITSAVDAPASRAFPERFRRQSLLCISRMIVVLDYPRSGRRML